EVGVGPFAAMAGYHIIQNKVVPSAGIGAGLIKRHPYYDYEVLENTAELCRLRFTRSGAEIGISSFSIEDAKTQGALDGRHAATWVKFPRNMLFARAMTNGIKWYCPDLTFGDLLFSEEEYDQASAREVRREAAPPAQRQLGGVEPQTAPIGGDNDQA